MVAATLRKGMRTMPSEEYRKILNTFLVRDPRQTPLTLEETEELQLALGQFLYDKPERYEQLRHDPLGVQPWGEDDTVTAVSPDVAIQFAPSGHMVLRTKSAGFQVIATFTEAESRGLRDLQQTDPKLFTTMVKKFGDLQLTLLGLAHMILSDFEREKSLSVLLFAELTKDFIGLAEHMSRLLRGEAEFRDWSKESLTGSDLEEVIPPREKLS